MVRVCRKKQGFIAIGISFKFLNSNAVSGLGLWGWIDTSCETAVVVVVAIVGNRLAIARVSSHLRVLGA